MQEKTFYLDEHKLDITKAGHLFQEIKKEIADTKIGS